MSYDWRREEERKERREEDRKWRQRQLESAVKFRRDLAELREIESEERISYLEWLGNR